MFVGIDISKEKLNLCLRTAREIVCEEEIENTVAVIKRQLKKNLKALETTFDDVLICAEYTGRYIYPLTCGCQELGIFLWMEDPTRIRNSFGVTRGKSDAVDARRIAEYAFRFNDKAVAYALRDKDIVSLKNLLSDRELLLADRKKYEAQLSDQKKFLSAKDYGSKSLRWKKVISAIREQLASIEAEMQAIVDANDNISHQAELLKSDPGVGDRLAINMIVISDGFTRFNDARRFNCYAGLTPFRYTSGKSIYSKAKVSQRANKHIKSLLHLCAVCVATYVLSGEYRDYYERRKAEGKHPMCILNIIRAKIVAHVLRHKTGHSLRERLRLCRIVYDRLLRGRPRGLGRNAPLSAANISTDNARTKNRKKHLGILAKFIRIPYSFHLYRLL